MSSALVVGEKRTRCVAKGSPEPDDRYIETARRVGGEPVAELLFTHYRLLQGDFELTSFTSAVCSVIRARPTIRSPFWCEVMSGGASPRAATRLRKLCCRPHGALDRCGPQMLMSGFAVAFASQTLETEAESGEGLSGWEVVCNCPYRPPDFDALAQFGEHLEPHIRHKRSSKSDFEYFQLGCMADETSTYNFEASLRSSTRCNDYT